MFFPRFFRELSSISLKENQENPGLGQILRVSYSKNRVYKDEQVMSAGLLQLRLGLLRLRLCLLGLRLGLLELAAGPARDATASRCTPIAARPPVTLTSARRRRPRPQLCPILRSRRLKGDESSSDGTAMSRGAATRCAAASWRTAPLGLSRRSLPSGRRAESLVSA